MFRRKKTESVHLPVEIQSRVSLAKELLEETKRREKEAGFGLTLTYKMQLDDDKRALRRMIEKVEKGNYEKSNMEKLEKAVQCLTTTSENILEWTWKKENGSARKYDLEPVLPPSPSSLNHTGSVNLRTERLRIRRFDMDDLEDLYNNYGSDPLVRVYINFSPCQTEEGCKEFVEMHLEKYETEDTFYGWGIEYDGHIIGSIGAFDANEEIGSIELDYSIGSRYWNKGIVTEAADAVVHHLMEKVGFHKVFASCQAENKGSMRVMEKIGMLYEGRNRHGVKRPDGSYADLCYYSILASDL